MSINWFALLLLVAGCGAVAASVVRVLKRETGAFHDISDPANERP